VGVQDLLGIVGWCSSLGKLALEDFKLRSRNSGKSAQLWDLSLELPVLFPHHGHVVVIVQSSSLYDIVSFRPRNLQRQKGNVTHFRSHVLQ
jgi:hypothetical protein